jgi:hypothetical protein
LVYFGISAKVARGVMRDWTSRNMRSFGSPFIDKSKLRACLKDSAKKNYSASIETDYE